MQWIKPDTKIDFMRKKEWALVGSALLILAGLLSILFRGGLHYGIDFIGGTLVQIRFEKPVHLEEVRAGLKTVGLGDSLLQQFGEPHEVLIRFGSFAHGGQDPTRKIVQALHQVAPDGKIEVRRVEVVGPQVSHALQQKALAAVLISLVGMFLYVAYRFGIAWASGGVLALIHDVSIVVGIFSLTGKELTLPVVAALLTLIGYSINDTIVVFDRIREKVRKNPRVDFAETINESVNETLSRTTLTSFTVFLVVGCLFVWGGEVLRDFSFALLIGLVVGTYSSIFIASPVLVYWPRLSALWTSRSRKSLAAPKGNPHPLPKVGLRDKKRV